MDKKEREISFDEALHELSMEELEDIAGGKIKAQGYAALAAAVAVYKELGKDREYAINAIRKGWEKGCDFKTQFCDGTDDDLEKAIKFINIIW